MIVHEELALSADLQWFTIEGNEQGCREEAGQNQGSGPVMGAGGGIIDAMELITLILAAIGCLLGGLAFVKLILGNSGVESGEQVEEALETLARKQETAVRDEFERARDGREKSEARLREE
ncbi:MAG: hypothetical protein VXX30_06260, partial [Planctomycetota bacterium]|nr:hypothetical protein [Planctomycetota bacterium]